jgi:hypothetical protein
VIADMMLLWAETNFGSLLVLAGLALFCSVLLIRANRQSRAAARRSTAGAPAESARPPLAISKTSSQGSHRATPEVELHDYVRSCIAQLDNRRVMLEQLLRSAEAAALRLERLLAQAEQLGVDGATRRSAVPREPLHAATQAAGLALAGLAGAPSDERPPENGRSDASLRRAEVQSLAERGLNSSAIAQQLALPLGEVELVLNLRAPA